MDHSERLYIKGFNSGYLLAKNLPELLSKALKGVTPKDDFSAGLFSGRDEFELEKFRTQEKKLTNLRAKSRERGRDLERE